MTPLLTGVFASQISGHLNTFSPTGSYDALATYTVPSGGVSSVEFAGLPAGGQYTHLQIRGIVTTNRSGSAQDDMGIRFNDDTNTSNYRGHRLYGFGSNFKGSDSISGYSFATAGFTGGDNAGTNVFGAVVIDILDAFSTTKNKTTRALSGVDCNNTDGGVALVSGLWMSTSPANKITLLPLNGSLFKQNTQFAVYGVK